MFVLIKNLLLLYVFTDEIQLSSISSSDGSSVNQICLFPYINVLTYSSILFIKLMKSKLSRSNNKSEYIFLPVIEIPFFVDILGV